jgi:hypothetical protein
MFSPIAKIHRALVRDALHDILTRDAASANALSAMSAMAASIDELVDCIAARVDSSNQIETLLVPLRVTAAACNVYGMTHGGCLASTSDAVSTLHAMLLADDLRSSARVTSVASDIKYHVGVKLHTPLVACSTRITDTVFAVDLVPEDKLSPLHFDQELQAWRFVSRPHAAPVFAAKTFTRGTYTKVVER